MAEINKPDYTYLWSSGGAIVAPSNVKIQTGWTDEVPPFQWENWSQNRQDQAIAHILQHGISVWDALTEYQAGKSYVQGSDGLLYKARTTNTNVNPVSDTSFVNWTKALSGGLLSVQVFSASGTYTPTPGTTSVVVEACGGGGGGGGVPATGVGSLSIGAGGGAGAYAKSRYTSGFSGVTVTIGAAGTAGTIGGNGGNGGVTSFGVLMTVGGGLGGNGVASSGSPPFGLAGSSGGAKPTTGNIINQAGGHGMPASAFVAASFFSGDGGSSHFGAGAKGIPTSTLPGNAALSSGSGGSGAANGASSAGQVGGAGAAGIVIIWEYA